jgi:hypothetical protein
MAAATFAGSAIVHERIVCCTKGDAGGGAESDELNQMVQQFCWAGCSLRRPRPAGEKRPAAPSVPSPTVTGT